MKYISGNLSEEEYADLLKTFDPTEENVLDKKLPHVGLNRGSKFFGNCIFKFKFQTSSANTQAQIIPQGMEVKKVLVDGEKVELESNSYTFPEEGIHVVKIFSSDIWTSIGGTFINGWINLKEIEFPSSIEVINFNSIVGCSGLEKLKFGKKLREINGDLSALDLEEIEISKRNKNLRLIDGKYIISYEHPDILLGTLDGTIPTNSQIKKLSGDIYTGKTLTDFVIPGNIEELGDSVFEGCIFIGSLELGEGIKKIDSKAFYNIDITGLDSLIIKPQNPPIIESPQYFELRDIDENGDLIPGSEFYTNFEKNILPYRNSSVWNTLFLKLQTHNRNWYKSQYLTLEALETGTFSFNLAGYNYGSYINVTSVSYSIDGGNNWVTLDNIDTSVSNVITTPAIRGGDKVIWKGTAIKYGNNGGGGIYSYFSSTGSFSVSGNIMSLIYGDNFENQTEFLGDANANMGSLTQKACIFSGLFRNSNVIEANNLILPAPILAESCYSGMFRDCTSLIAPPVLPATTLANYCYSYMFSGCTSLTVVPELSALTLANNCYGNMFQNCKSLVQAPSLPATTLAERCYQYMFIGCRSLVESPVLPAETLISQCYACMFSDCYNLRRIKAMFTTTPTTGYSSPTYNWVANIPSGGTFIKNSAATWNLTGICGIPSGWTVETASS